MILIYIPNPNLKTAQKIARHLLNKKLIACANIFPINSIYRWQKKIVDDKEVVLLSKTLAKNWPKIKKEVLKIHPYELPCLLKLKIETNESFAKWLWREVK